MQALERQAAELETRERAAAEKEASGKATDVRSKVGAEAHASVVALPCCPGPVVRNSTGALVLQGQLPTAAVAEHA